MLQTIRLERVYILAAAVAVLISGKMRLAFNASTLAVGCFTLAMAISVLASPWTEASLPNLEEYLKLLFFYVLIVLTIHSRDELRTIVLGYLGVMFVYMAHSVREFRNGRYDYAMGMERMIGVDNTLSNPNSFAASIVYSLPILITFWIDNPSLRMKWFQVCYFLLAGVCAVYTGSRSAMVCFLLFLASRLLNVKRRGRYLIAAAVLLPFVFFLMPQRYQKRFESIIKRDESTAGYHSAEQRTEAFWDGLELLKRFPVSGCGLGAWQQATQTRLESHNLYAQVLGETGILGTAAFLFLVWTIVANNRWIRKTYQSHPDWDRDFLYHLSHAINVAILLMLVLGWGAHSLIRYNWLWLSAFGSIAREAVRQKLVQSGSTQH